MATFKELIGSDKPVLVDFFATWCGPCKMMSPILEQLKKEMGEDLTILKIDVDRNAKAASVYQIQGVPTLMLFKGGQVLWRESGVLPLANLKQVVRQHM